MAKDRRAMANPFAGIKKTQEEGVPSETIEETATPKDGVLAKGAIPSNREFVGFRLSPALLERARAVAWTQRLTLTAYVEAALEAAVVSAERDHGGAFPPVPRRQRRAS